MPGSRPNIAHGATPRGGVGVWGCVVMVRDSDALAVCVLRGSLCVCRVVGLSVGMCVSVSVFAFGACGLDDTLLGSFAALIQRGVPTESVVELLF